MNVAVDCGLGLGFEFAFDSDFRFTPPLFRHRVAEAGQGISARTV